MDRLYRMVSYMLQADRKSQHAQASVATMYINAAFIELRAFVQLLLLQSVERADKEALSRYMAASGCCRHSIAAYMNGSSKENKASRNC